MRHCPLTGVTVFWKFWFGGNCLKKRKKNLLKILEILGNVQHFQNPRWQFCSPIHYTSFHLSQLIVALKLHQWQRFPWTHFVGQNRRNMTSLWRHSRLTYYDLGPIFLTQGVELFPGEVWEVWKRNSPVLQKLFAKNHRGALGPPSGARVKGTVSPLTKLSNICVCV